MCKYCKYLDSDKNNYPCERCTYNSSNMLGSKDTFFMPCMASYKNEECAYSDRVDNVEHPAHYTGKYECIDVMTETQGVETVKNFCICNAFKYLWRHDKKNGVEDVKKAAWYLNKFIELEERSKDE